MTGVTLEGRHSIGVRVGTCDRRIAAHFGHGQSSNGNPGAATGAALGTYCPDGAHCLRVPWFVGDKTSREERQTVYPDRLPHSAARPAVA